MVRGAWCVLEPAVLGEGAPALPARDLREVMLRQVDQNLLSDTAHAEWYTPGAEMLLQKLLSRLPEAPAAESKRSKANPVEGWDMFATEALFLLCRAQMGCLEAALKELDRASRTVARVRDHATWCKNLSD